MIKNQEISGKRPCGILIIGFAGNRMAMPDKHCATLDLPVGGFSHNAINNFFTGQSHVEMFCEGIK